MHIYKGHEIIRKDRGNFKHDIKHQDDDEEEKEKDKRDKEDFFRTSFYH